MVVYRPYPLSPDSMPVGEEIHLPDNATYREVSEQYSASRLACFTRRSVKLRIYFPAFVKLFSRHPKWKCRMLLESPFTVSS